MNFNINRNLRRCAALVLTSALLFSGSISNLPVAAENTEIVNSGADSTTQLRIYNNTRDMDISDSPNIYLDNSDIADGKTSTSVTVTLVDKDGKLVDKKGERIAYDISEPNNSIIVEDVTPKGETSSVTLNISSEKTENGTVVPLNPGIVTITFSNTSGTVNTVLRCSVFKPATDMLVYWDGSETPLPLNDFCESNSTQLNAVENHSYQITTGVIPSNSTDQVTWAVWDGVYNGEKGESPKATDKATVSADGIFTAKSEGTVTLVGKFAMTGSSPRLYCYGEKELYSTNGGSTKANVKTVPKYIHINIVKENPALMIIFDDPPEVIEEGETLSILPEITPSFTGNGYSESTDKFRWVSSDPNVVSVDQDGTIKGLAKGEATITLYGENPDVYAEQKIRVIRKATSITLTPKTAQTRVGVSMELTAVLPDGQEDEIKWEVSDSKIASIEPVNKGEYTASQTAILTGLSEGTVTVTATALHSGMSAESTVVVKKSSENDGIKLFYEGKDGELPIVDSSVLNVYTNQNIKINSSTSSETVSKDIVWEIFGNDEDYITIPNQDSESITIHGTSQGTVTVKSYLQSNPAVSRVFYVTVLKACDNVKIIDSEKVEIPKNKFVNVGSLFTVFADLTIDGNYPYQHSDKIEKWETSDASIAQVDNNGNIRAVSNGSVKITVKTASGKTASKDITVFTTSQVIMNKVEASANGNLPTATIGVDRNMEGKTTLGVTIKDQDNNIVRNVDCIWTSSDPSVATVDKNGVVTAVNLGKTTITVKSGNKYDQCNLTVTAPIQITEIDPVTTQIYSPIKQYYEPKPTITFFGYTLIEGLDYHFDYENNTKLGRAKMSIVGERYFTGSVNRTFDIQAKQLTDPEIQVEPIERVKCTGQNVMPEPVITCSGMTLNYETDYTYSYTNNQKPGTATITIRGVGNYTGSIKKNFEIYCNHESVTDAVVVREPTCAEVGISSCTCNICGEKIETEIEKIPHTFEEKIVEPTANEEGYTLHYCTVCGGYYKDNYTEKVPGINITDCIANLSGTKFAYTGSEIKPKVSLRYHDTALVENADFLVTYLDNIEKGTAYAIITGIGMYVGTGKIQFSIDDTGDIIESDTDTQTEIVTTDSDVLSTDDDRIDITQKGVGSLPTVVYNPSSVPYEPKPVVNLGNNALIENVDFVMAYANNDKVGTASVVMTGIGRYKGVARFEFDILAKPLTDADITVKAIDKQKCTGKAVTPQPVVICGTNDILANRRDYKVTYTDNVNPGVATAVITGIGNYTGSLSLSFRIECEHQYSEQIVPPTYNSRGYTLHTCNICKETYRDNYTEQLQAVDIKNCDVTLEYDSISYTGEELKPSVRIVYNGKVVEPESNYTVSYGSNINVGVASVTITGKGAYTGTIIKTFQILSGTIGDLNADGVVSAEDALSVLRSTVGLLTLDDFQRAMADVNHDGEVTAEDSLLILRSTVGLQQLASNIS